MGNAEYMGIHNSSGPPIEQRVGSPITEKNTKKISMKAFTTACALIAGVSAESHIGLPLAGSFSPVYGHGVAHHPLTYSRPVYGPVYTGVHHPIVHHPIVHHPIFKREADAEPRFTYQTKVTHPDEKSGYEYRVNVDPMGNGHSSASSYQFHEQQRDNMMRQQQRQNQMGNQMLFGRVDQFNCQQMQYGMDNRMGGRMDMHNQMVRQRNNQMMAGRDNQMVNEHGYDMFDQYLRRQDGRMNNFYSYERMLQRQNEARRNMNNQHRMFKREAEPSFEYDVTAEHENNNPQMVSRNQQMMDVMTRPQQQTYRGNDQMDSHMNQINNHRMQYNMDNRMDGRMNQKERMMQQRNQHMNQFNNQRINQHSNQMDQYNRHNMENQTDSRMNPMDTRRNHMDTHMNRMDTHMNRMDTQMNQMHGRNDQRMQYNRNNQMTNQMHQRQFDDFFPGTFSFNRDSMQFQNNRFQQDQFRNYY